MEGDVVEKKGKGKFKVRRKNFLWGCGGGGRNRWT